MPRLQGMKPERPRWPFPESNLTHRESAPFAALECGEPEREYTAILGQLAGYLRPGFLRLEGTVRRAVLVRWRGRDRPRAPQENQEAHFSEERV
jgi:hypothetical protein